MHPDLFDGPLGGAHTVHHTCPFEGRPGGTGAGDQPIAGTEHHFAVGPHVEEERNLLAIDHAG